MHEQLNDHETSSVKAQPNRLKHHPKPNRNTDNAAVPRAAQSGEFPSLNQNE